MSTKPDQAQVKFEHPCWFDMKLHFLLAVGLFAGSCQNVTRPSAILMQPDVLVIVPSVEGLKLGATQVLTAVLVSNGRPGHTVPASWTSDAPGVVAVSEDGRVRAVSLGSATISANVGERSAKQSLRVVPDYDGIWSGDYRVTACNRLRGNGPSYCRFIVGADLFIKTVLTQDGLKVSGTIEFYSDTHELLEAGEVEASLGESGALILTATTSSAQSEQEGSTTLSEWNTMVAADGQRLTGTFVKNRHFRNAFGWQDSREECEISNVRRTQP
jgi:hypothetical protein